MGSTQGKVFSQHDDRNWRPKEPNSNRWINIHTGTEAVETLLTFPSTEAAEQEMDRYEQRRNCPHANRVCYGSIVCRVLMEPVKTHLSNIHLTDDEYYYVMRECLLGFQQLYRLHGFIAVARDMIGINHSGQVKIWLNPIFSENNKDYRSKRKRDSLTKDHADLEGYMVGKLVYIISKQAVNQRLQQTRFEGGFSQAIRHFDLEAKLQGVTSVNRIGSIADKRTPKSSILTSPEVPLEAKKSFRKLGHRRAPSQASFSSTIVQRIGEHPADGVLQCGDIALKMRTEEAKTPQPEYQKHSLTRVLGHNRLSRQTADTALTTSKPPGM